MARASLLHAPVSRKERANATAEGPTLWDEMALAGSAFDPVSGLVRRDVSELLIKRTMTGSASGGYLGGFAVKPEWADTVWDKARSIDGPLARCVIAPCLAREFKLPGYLESSRGNTGRWGGVQAAWGAGEISSLTSQQSQPELTLINFRTERLVIWTSPISRDLLADSLIMPLVLSYAAQSELRFAIEYAMVRGPAQMPSGGQSAGGPQGVVDSFGNPGAGVVAVAKDSMQSSGTISTTNIDAAWGAIYGPCKRNAIWIANDDTIQAIDEVATSAGWPQATYLPQGVGGNQFPLIKGRPLVMSEACPAIGTPGDLICADWSQYWFVYHKPKPTDSGLAFDLAIPRDDGHLGIVALPGDAIEQRQSGERYYDQDEVSFLWKLRADGRSIWPSTMTTLVGATVGWASVIQKR
jgi:HK97 family phage major capsid protein